MLNLIDIALLRAKARQVGIKDIRQKSGDVLFTLSNLNFEAVGALCSDPDYKQRVTFLASAKEPTLRFKLANGVDSLKQSKLFVDALYQLFPELTFLTFCVIIALNPTFPQERSSLCLKANFPIPGHTGKKNVKFEKSFRQLTGQEKPPKPEDPIFSQASVPDLDAADPGRPPVLSPRPTV